MGNATRQIKRMRQKEQAHTSRPHWSKEKKKKVGIICGIVIAVLLLFLMFWTPAGTVKTWFGKPMFVADNAILVKNNDYYYSLGTYQLPEGYTKDTEYSVVQDKNRFELKADSVDESSPVAFFYMTPVASPDIDSIRNSFHGMYEECSEVKTMTVCGREAQWFDYTYQSDNEKDFLIRLRDLTELNLKILDCQRTIIERNVEKGLLPSFTSGLVDFEHLYSTVGINGIYETMKTFGYIRKDEFDNTYYTEEAYSLGRRIFEVIRNSINNFSLDKNYKFNIEQVPAEQAAAKMLMADKLLYPDKVVEDLPLYGNQWIPLGIKATVLERTKICAAFDSYCNGGSIEHINLDAPFSTFDQAWEMLNWVAQQGVTYFAFNGKVAQCKNYHSFYGKVCPICGEPVETEYTRIVGFYTPTKSYSKERKAEFKLREWMPLNEKGPKA